MDSTDVPSDTPQAAITAYKQALDALEGHDRGKGSDARVLAVLLSRNRIALMFATSDTLVPADVLQVDELDGRMAKHATQLRKRVHPATIEHWRELLGRSPDDWWWWKADRINPAIEMSRHPFFTLIAAGSVLGTVALFAEVSIRFLSGGPDATSIAILVIQTVLALVAILVTLRLRVFRAVERQVERLLTFMRVPDKHHHLGKSMMALGLLGVAAVCYLALPLAARIDNEQGLDDQVNGRLTSAIGKYHRAIKLAPDYAQAHYNLASASEDVLDFDVALSEYERAILADPHFYQAYNNLGRLYISRRADYASGLKLLDEALESRPPSVQLEPGVLYSLYKNRGWAYLGLKLPGSAQRDLQHALAVRPDGAAAHCLLAQVLEARGANAEAMPHWEDCVRYASADTVEPTWLAMSKDRLGEGSQ